MDQPPAGFREIDHTADWELEVWAPDLLAFLEQAARGMYALSKPHYQPHPQSIRILELFVEDNESLLVNFLSELLYLGEHDGLAAVSFNLSLIKQHFKAKLHCSPVLSFEKEIKAVTYHNLTIRSSTRGLEARIVFDV